jgi:hypothetical protein
MKCKCVFTKRLFFDIIANIGGDTVVNVYLPNHIEEIFNEHLRNNPKYTKSSLVQKFVQDGLQSLGYEIKEPSKERGQYVSDKVVLRQLKRIIREHGGEVTKRSLRELSDHGFKVIHRVLENHSEHFHIRREKNAYLISVDEEHEKRLKESQKKLRREKKDGIQERKQGKTSRKASKEIN